MVSSVKTSSFLLSYVEYDLVGIIVYGFFHLFFIKDPSSTGGQLCHYWLLDRMIWHFG